MQRHRLGAPLRLELERAFVRRRAAHVEHRRAALPARTESRPNTAARSGTARCSSRIDDAHGSCTIVARAIGQPGGDRLRRSAARRGSARDPGTRAALPRTAAANTPACRGRACCARTRRRNRRPARRRRARPTRPDFSALRIWLRTLRSSALPHAGGRAASRIDTLCCLHGRLGKLRARRGAARRGCTPRARASCARRSTSASRDLRRVGHHAAVVEERQRRQRAAEQQALDLHHRQHAGDQRRPRARSSRPARGRTRPRTRCRQSPRVVAGGVAARVDVRFPGAAVARRVATEHATRVTWHAPTSRVGGTRPRAARRAASRRSVPNAKSVEQPLEPIAASCQADVVPQRVEPRRPAAAAGPDRLPTDGCRTPPARLAR